MNINKTNKLVIGGKTMTIKQIKCVFKDKEQSTCPITEKLIKAGYQQKNGGYIAKAKEAKIEVDYKKALPTQSWHLIDCYCVNKADNIQFTKKIVCGELIFWMAEVLECVEKSELLNLCNEIINSPMPCRDEQQYINSRPVYCRKKWNEAIQDLCFDKIVEKVEREYNNLTQ